MTRKTTKGALEVAAHIEAGTEVDGHAAPAASKRNSLPVLAAPTQLRRPWRSTARTVFQATIALAAMWAIIVQELGLPDWAWVGTSVAVAGGITRVMALPMVEQFLRQFLPFLAAAPKPKAPTP